MVYLIAGMLSMLAFLLWRIGKHILQAYHCPGEAALKDFWFRRMDKNSQEYRSLITHLGQCEKCRDELYRIQKGKPLEDHLIEE